MKDWTDLIAKRKAARSLPAMSLAEFPKRIVIRLGIETECSHCKAKNWSSLTAADYRVTCERCLKPYDFPQAELSCANITATGLIARSGRSRCRTTAVARMARFW